MAEKIKLDITKKTLLYDNVLVRIVDVVKVDDVLIDPRQYDDKPDVGEVIATGNGRLQENGNVVPCVVQVGDIVLFNKYSSVKYRNPATSEDLLVIREEDVICH